MSGPDRGGCGCGGGDCGVTPARTTGTAGLRLAADGGDAGPDLVCTLDGAMRERVDRWRAVIGRATGREPHAAGVTLGFDHDPAVTVELARLAAAEFACCSFFTFALTVGPGGTRFTVTAPAGARHLVTALFGSAGPAAPADR
jgi:hypothetical protein